MVEESGGGFGPRLSFAPRLSRERPGNTHGAVSPTAASTIVNLSSIFLNGA